MEIFGNNFDDDLFESKKSTPQSTVRLDLSWTPNFCEPKVRRDEIFYSKTLIVVINQFTFNFVFFFSGLQRINRMMVKV